jgi:hypothetical protein
MSQDIHIDSEEAFAALSTLISRDPDLLSEVDELFLGENARFDAGGLFCYCFKFPASPTDWTNGQRAELRARDQNERLAVLAAPDRYGLERRVAHVGL